VVSRHSSPNLSARPKLGLFGHGVGPKVRDRICRQQVDMGVTMRKFIRKCALGIASVLALSIAGTALDYAADPGNAVADSDNTITAGSTPAVSHTPESWRGGDFIRKDDIRWAQLELRYRGLYKGSLDGVLGPKTRQALAQFQKNNSLDQTASLDAQTWETLTDNPDIGQGSSMPSNGDHTGTASHLGK
jgi:peptidoglycan hydrolase-like protein with peptidoglycan-binding domain